MPTGDLSAAPGRPPTASDPELSAALDAELNELPDKYRAPVVLCYLQGKTYEEAAAELNCPVGTLSTWLTRAKALLRARLTRRGLAPGGLAALLNGLNAQAADGVSRFLTETAVGFAAGDLPPGRATAVATGVIRSMNWKSRFVPALGALVIVLGLAAVAASLEPPSKPAPAARPAVSTDADKLQGVWVFDSAQRGKGDALGMVWASRVTIRGDAVTVEPFLDDKLTLKGRLRLDPNAEPKRFTLVLDELDITPIGAPAKIAAGEYPGVYELDGSHLTVCLTAEKGGPRPAALDADGERTIRARLVKAPAGFKEVPKEVTVKAVGADGQPVSGAVVAEFMNRMPPRIPLTPEGKPVPSEKWTAEQRSAVEKDRAEREKERPADGVVRDKTTGWTFSGVRTTGADGTAKVSFAEEPSSTVIVRDPAHKLMGFGRISPAALVAGRPVEVALRPECRVIVPCECRELAEAKRGGVYHAYAETRDGRRVAFTYDYTGRPEFLLPPGEYTLHAYGGEFVGTKRVPLTVPKDRSEYTADPVVLPATGLLRLIGRPAPELADVVGWKGAAVKLSDLKGKYVLLEFWGWWCGPCIGHMPTLMAVHDRFKDKGVVVVGVHVDADGEIRTAEELDAKLVQYRKDVWKGRDVPFPVALTSGKRTDESENAPRGALAGRYGIRSYPSTILIDPEGKVVGPFHERETAAAIKQIEALLQDAKKEGSKK